MLGYDPDINDPEIPQVYKDAYQVDLQRAEFLWLVKGEKVVVKKPMQAWMSDLRAQRKRYDQQRAQAKAAKDDVLINAATERNHKHRQAVSRRDRDSQLAMQRRIIEDDKPKSGLLMAVFIGGLLLIVVAIVALGVIYTPSAWGL